MNVRFNCTFVYKTDEMGILHKKSSLFFISRVAMNANRGEKDATRALVDAIRAEKDATRALIDAMSAAINAIGAE